jgi:hypothetical protein
LSQAGQASLAGDVHHAASSAFFHGFSAGNLVAAGVAAAGTIMAILLLPAHPARAGIEVPGWAQPAPAVPD